jgi:hypothetical protein
MSAAVVGHRQRYRCKCRHVFQAFGGGRHRRFYELDDMRWLRPVVTRVCPDCDRKLPTTRGLLSLSGPA